MSKSLLRKEDMHRTHHFNRLDRTEQVRQFLMWLPSDIHDAPGVEWTRLPGEVMAYFVCVVRSTPDAPHLAMAMAAVGGAVRTTSLMKMLSSLYALFCIFRAECAMKQVSDLKQEEIWHVYAEKTTERPIGRTTQLRVYSSISTKYFPAFLTRLTEEERLRIEPYALPKMPRGFLKQQSGVVPTRGPIRVAKHLTEAEVKAKINGARQAWLKRRWEIVHTALVYPRPVIEISSDLDVSSIVVQRVLSGYSREGASAIETGGPGGRHGGYLTLAEERAFIAPFLARAQRGDPASIKEVKHAFEKRVQRKVAETTIYRLLSRYDWKKVTHTGHSSSSSC